MFRNYSGILVVLFVCSVVGCGNEFGKPVVITGKVTLAGKPVERARIIFRANDGKLPAELRTLVAELKPDGTYSFEKAYLTEYVVMLESTEAMDATKSAEPAPSPLTPYGADSKLRAKVTVDMNKFDFDLPASVPGLPSGVPGIPGGIPGIPGGAPM